LDAPVVSFFTLIVEVGSTPPIASVTVPERATVAG
jgi:hypothetical protein